MLVISDSHVPNRAPEIPELFKQMIIESKKVIHCGDFATEEVYDSIDGMTEELVAVRGNCDFFDLPNSETFKLNDVRFGVYHGTGIKPRGDHKTLVDIAKNKLGVDILLHGHTHQQEAVKEEEVILLNPGSCTGVGGGSSRKEIPRAMIVGVKDNSIEVDLLRLESEGIESQSRNFDI